MRPISTYILTGIVSAPLITVIMSELMYSYLTVPYFYLHHLFNNLIKTTLFKRGFILFYCTNYT